MLTTQFRIELPVGFGLKFFSADNETLMSAATNFTALIKGGNVENNFAPVNRNDFKQRQNVCVKVLNRL